jgi:hypothetical protein
MVIDKFKTALAGACAVLVVLIGSAGALAQQEQRSTFSWIDENGQRVFSDRPRPGAQGSEQIRIDVPKPPSNPFSGLDESTAEEPDAAEEAEPDEFDEPITVSVVRPGPDETFVNTGGRVQVGVNVSPRLPRDGRVRVYLDGALAATGGPGQQSFLLESVFRGEHTVAAGVTDATGTEVSRSLPVRFFVRQASLIRPP